LRAKRKRIPEDRSRAGVGLIINISLFLILLTFFILLNSIAVMDGRKIRMAIGSLSGAFGSLTGGLSPLKTGDSIMPPSAPITEQKLDLAGLFSIMDQRMISLITFDSRADREVITISEEILFNEYKTKLKSSSYPFLDKLCELIKGGEYPVEIIGHTDNRPAEEKGYSSNWELSSLMALQVLKYFLEKGGIPPKRLTAYGCGTNKPIFPNDTRQLRAQNRRIDIILKHKMPAYIQRIYKRNPSGLFTYKRFNFKIF
jgi:chemotaxis protein MotB